MAPSDAGSAALDALLDRHGNLVRLVGHRTHLDEADLDEVVQDVRIRLWRANPDVRTLAETSATYLYRTAMSAAVDLLRRRRRREADPIPEDGLVDEKSQAGQAAEVADVSRAIYAGVGGLIDSRRPVVRMYLAGYDRAQIASVLGWTEAKTRNLLYRGLADLRSTLQAAGFGPEGSS